LTKIATCGLAEETKKKKKGGSSKSQNHHFSPPCGTAISQPICTKFGEFVDPTKVITPAKFGWFQNIHWFFHAERWKKHISFLSKRV